MSLPACLTNPSLRLVKIKDQFYTIEKAGLVYALWHEGHQFGLVSRDRNRWTCEPCRVPLLWFKTRHEAFLHLIAEWHRGKRLLMDAQRKAYERNRTKHTGA